MNLLIERRVIAHANGDADEFITALLENPGPNPELLEETWLQFPVTDALCDAVHVCDGLPGNPEWWASELDVQFLVAVRPRGSVEPQGVRIVGAHILSRERCAVASDRVTFLDSFLLGSLDVLRVDRLSVTTVLVFPANVHQRQVCAPQAIEATSRTVTWNFRPTGGRPYRPFASQEAAPPIRPAVSLLDDGIAALQHLIGCADCGEAGNAEDTMATLSLAFHEAGLALPDSVTALDSAAELPLFEWQQRCRSVLRDVSGWRGRLLASAQRRPSIAADSTSLDTPATLRHSDDFSVVWWRDQPFHFNRRQAAAVRRLANAFQASIPDLHQNSLADSAGWAPGPLGQNFHRHPAWGTLIVPGKAKGTYRLNP